MLAAWRRTSIKQSVPERMAITLSEAAVSITITSVTDILSFTIGVFSPFPSVTIFCIYSGKLFDTKRRLHPQLLFVYFRGGSSLHLLLAPDVLRGLPRHFRLLRTEEPALGRLHQGPTPLQVP